MTIDRRVAELLTGVDCDRLRGHVESLATIGPRCDWDPVKVDRSIEYMGGVLTDCGYRISTEPIDGTRQVNLIATRRGSDDEVFEVGAHYDTVPGSPGADDNASGIAGVLELARMLATVELHRSVRFCLFGAEEIGILGSAAHVARLDEHERHAGIIVFEMIGYRTAAPNSQRSPARIPGMFWPPRRGSFIAAVGNSRSARLVSRWTGAARRYAPDLEVFSVRHLGSFLPDAARSDHRPYWRSGRRGIMVTDTANFRNPHYHRPTDTPETLDYGFLTDVVRATGGHLLEWAGLAD